MPSTVARNLMGMKAPKVTWLKLFQLQKLPLYFDLTNNICLSGLGSFGLGLNNPSAFHSNSLTTPILAWLAQPYFRCSWCPGVAWSLSQDQSTSLKCLLGQRRQQGSGEVLREHWDKFVLAASRFIGTKLFYDLKLRHRKGFNCASFDFDYDSRAMDFNGCAGFLFLSSSCAVVLYHMYLMFSPSFLFSGCKSQGYVYTRYPKKSPMQWTSSPPFVHPGGFLPGALPWDRTSTGRVKHNIRLLTRPTSWSAGVCSDMLAMFDDCTMIGEFSVYLYKNSVENAIALNLRRSAEDDSISHCDPCEAGHLCNREPCKFVDL